MAISTELWPHQADALLALRQTVAQGVRRICVQSPTGSGKCVSFATPVLLYDGRVVQAKDIVPGDLLMGPDSRPRTVLSTCVGVGPMFDIVPTKGDTWSCNDVHVLTLVETVSGRVVDIPLDEYLCKSKTFKHTHKLFQPEGGVDFAVSEAPDVDPYFLGVWLGDGTKNLHSLQVTKPDREIADICEQVAVANGGHVSVIGMHRGCPTYSIVIKRGATNPLLRRMRALMEGDCIPHSVLVAPREYRMQVLAGLIDTDGYVHNGYCEIAQKRRSYADGIAFLARSLGFRVTMCEKPVNGVVYYRMNILGDLSKIPTRIARKTASPRKQVKNALRTGFSVVPKGVGVYCGFELDGDGRFLLGDFTVTHNTKLAAAIVDGARSKGNRIAFVVPAIDLIDQTVESFYAEGMTDVGVIQADHQMTDWSKPIQVCSIQTIGRRGRPEASIVVVDECHRLYQAQKDWITDPLCEKVVFIGLSATPWTKGLGKFYDTLIVAETTQGLIEKGFLSRFKAFATGHPDLTGVKTVAGDYHEGQLSEAMQQGTLVADIIDTYKTRWGKGKTLVFGVDCTHAKCLQERFNQAGIPAGYQDAFTSMDERREIKRKFHNGDFQVVCNVGTLTTGVDWDVRCLVLARPTKSEMLYVQIIGRALRTNPEKEYALILDHSDTTSRLGLVTDIHHDQLDDGLPKPKAEKQKPLPKECSACGYLKPAGVGLCPNCGHQAKPPKNGKFEDDGELVEIDPARAKRAVARANGVADWTMGQKQTFFSELITFAEQHGFKPGWAARKYKDRLGVWPNQLIKEPAAYVSGPTRKWLDDEYRRWKAQRNSGFGANPA